ncbi:MAG: ISKra4 family transposase [Planctomycetes bacterium]|nr:ISKra4 family transposase [Planctomycetota bacterium]
MELYQIERLRVEQDEVLAAMRAFVEGAAQSKEAHEVERELFRMLQGLGLSLLKEMVARRGTGKVDGGCVGHDGCILPYHGLKTCRYLSIFGLVEIRRAYYWQAGQAGVFPLDASLNLPERRYSYLLDQWAQAGVVDQAYEKATTSLSELLGLPLWKRGQEQIARETATNVDDFYRQLDAPEDEGSVFCAQADGKGVRMVPSEKPMSAEAEAPVVSPRRGKGEKPGQRREAVVTALFTFRPEPRTPEEMVAALLRERTPEERAEASSAKARAPLNKTVFASLYGKEGSFARMADEIARRDPDEHRPIYMLLDAGSGLEQRFEEEMTRRGWSHRVEGVCLDIMHVQEYVWELANAIHGERGPARVEWVRRVTLELLRGQVGRVVGGWRQMLTKRGDRLSAPQKRALNKAIGYLDRHRHLMRYDQWLAQGFPIATGVVEGACGGLVKDRTDGSGMRWTRAGAQSVLHLRAVKKNGHWDAFWQYHIQREKERHYGKSAA